jgi:hypothetical protein
VRVRAGLEGEITDKGYVNQRRVLAHRSPLIEMLYAQLAPAEVIACTIDEADVGRVRDVPVRAPPSAVATGRAVTDYTLDTPGKWTRIDSPGDVTVRGWPRRQQYGRNALPVA